MRLCEQAGPANALDYNDVAKAFKIIGVMGKDGRTTVRQHRSDDIGVVDLFAADFVVCHQVQQFFCHHSVVILPIEFCQKLDIQTGFYNQYIKKCLKLLLTVEIQFQSVVF